MRKVFAIAAISSLLIISCQNKDSSIENISFDSSVVTHTTPVTTPVAVKDSASIQNPVQTTQTATVAAAGINPPHGQPGHRCDIAVGASLNSPVATTSKAVTQQPQPVVLNTTTPTPAKTLPGMNPPHGQPGHRCDIAVGAPLNSAPVKVETKTDAKTVAPVGTADSISKQ